MVGLIGLLDVGGTGFLAHAARAKDPDVRLLAAREHDPAPIAEHYLLAGAPAEAAPWFVKAAQRALDRGFDLLRPFVGIGNVDVGHGVRMMLQKPAQRLASAASAAAGARWCPGEIQALDPARRQLRLGDGTALDYDVLSLNVGSTLRPPPAEHAQMLPLRPPAMLRRHYEQLLERWAREPGDRPFVVTAVGGGAAGASAAGDKATAAGRCSGAGAGAGPGGRRGGYTFKRSDLNGKASEFLALQARAKAEGKEVTFID